MNCAESPTRSSEGRAGMREAQGPGRGAGRRALCACAGAACSHLGLVMAVALYVLLGALMFEYLESGHFQRKGAIQQSKEDCLKELWAITERLNVLYERNWTRLVHAQLRKFESSVVAGARRADAPAHDDIAEWTFTAALLYSFTLITTIGNGQFSPRTPAGKLASVAYAAGGVPLALLCLAALGGALARPARRLWTRLRSRHHSETDSTSQGREHNRLLQYAGGEMGRNQYTAFPPPAGHMVHVPRAGRYTHVFQRAPDYCRGHTAAAAGAHLHTDVVEMEVSPAANARRQHVAQVHAGGGAARGEGQRAPASPDTDHLLPSASAIPEEPSETEELESDGIYAHNTPSRVPLIWKSSGLEASANTTRAHSRAAARDLCRVPAPVVLLALAAYLALGALLFSFWEGWSFLDAAYFCFMTLATIGFGDIAPAGFHGGGGLHSPGAPTEYLQALGCCLYLLFGLVLIAMAFSLLQEEVVTRCGRLAGVLGLARQRC